MRRDPYAGLSAREREMMDIIHRLGEANAQQVRQAMKSPPTDATVRSTLRVLEEKGWVSHRTDAGRFIYRPLASRKKVREGVVQHVMQTFFDDSPAELIAALVDRRSARLKPGERERIKELLVKLEQGERP